MKKMLVVFGMAIFIISVLPAVHLFFNDFNVREQVGFNESRETISVYSSKTGKVTEEDIEEYLVGVVTAEMPALYEDEALKAQAVAARSYILSKKGTENPDHKDAEVCTDPAHCKAYTALAEAKENWGRDFEKYHNKIKTAVEATKGEYISYNGETAVACFYAVSGGRTENASDVWGGDTPYLRSVESPGDLNYDNLKASVSVSNDEAMSVLGVDSLRIGDVKRTEGGSVKTIQIGGKVFTGTEIRSLFKLNSANFEVQTTDKEVVFTTTGKGHGVGMSQFGANQMAKEGKTYREILCHYYRGVDIEKR